MTIPKEWVITIVNPIESIVKNVSGEDRWINPVKCLLLDVDNVIISQVEEVGADIGEPDCKLNQTIFV